MTDSEHVASSSQPSRLTPAEDMLKNELRKFDNCMAMLDDVKSELSDVLLLILKAFLF